MSNESTLTVSRTINANKKTIFEALTDENVMEKWFFAGPDGWSATVKSKAKVGEEYKIDMHGENDTYTHTGIYKEIIPHEKIVFTWNSQVVQDTVVTITLTEKGDATEVKLVHEFMPNQEMIENHTKGWAVILERLDHVVKG